MKSVQLLAFVFLWAFGPAHAQSTLPSDKKATKETVRLYNNLKKLKPKGFLFGHQDALAYGVNWKYEPGRSDVKDVTGEYPALYGWELGHLEMDALVNLDSVPFAKMGTYIREGYQRGGVITISWHGTNPLTGKSAWDAAPGTVASILPGGEKHGIYTAQLDRVANFLLSLKGEKGELIPVLYRPFHELTGGWFWWGNKTSTVDEFKQIFRFTVDYLREVKGVHNLLYVYNTGGDFNSAQEFLERYPGDDVIDVLSFDAYQTGNPQTDDSFVKGVSSRLSIIEQVAKEKNKLSAIGEIGYSQIPYGQWWTKTLLSALQGHQPSYVLLWRNAGYKAAEKTTEYYVPYKGQGSESDFLQFYRHPSTLFQKDVAAQHMYK